MKKKEIKRLVDEAMERLAEAESKIESSYQHIVALTQRLNFIENSNVKIIQGTDSITHYDLCACNPANGGNGVCHCILNSAKFTN